MIPPTASFPVPALVVLVNVDYRAIHQVLPVVLLQVNEVTRASTYVIASC